MGGRGSGRKKNHEAPLSPDRIIRHMEMKRAELRQELNRVDAWFSAVEVWILEASKLLGKSWNGKLWYPLGLPGDK